MYINTVKEKKLFDLNPRDIPHGIREQEFAKIIGIEFEIESSKTLCYLKVTFIYWKIIEKT